MGIKQSEWQGHLKAAETSGMSLSAYAAEHGINVRRLYEARYEHARAKARQASALVSVKVKPQSSVKVTQTVLRGDAF